MDPIAIADAYLRCSADLSRPDPDQDAVWEPERNVDQRAYDLVERTICDGPALTAWTLVREILRRAPDDRLDVEAAGPLENLVRRWGSELISQIETEARTDERFQWALGQIWMPTAELPPAIIARISAARGDEGSEHPHHDHAMPPDER